jgi:CrcB protein
MFAMSKILLIAAGGGLGSVARYVLAGWVQRLTDAALPVGTLAVNVLGCLLIGILGAIFAGPHLVREEYRLALLIGVLGGFTTFSTFGYETFEMANDGQFARAALNVVITNAACLAAVWIGYRITERLVGA